MLWARRQASSRQARGSSEGDTHALALHLFFRRWTSGALGIGKPVVGILSFMWGSEGTSGSLHEQTLWMRRSPRCGRGGREGKE